MNSKKSRYPSTTRVGGSFSDTTIQAVWEKAVTVAGHNPSIWRKDRCRKWILREDYGKVSSKFGWEIDHIIPISRGGTDDLDNLQPLFWGNNRHKGDKLTWSCKYTS